MYYEDFRIYIYQNEKQFLRFYPGIKLTISFKCRINPNLFNQDKTQIFEITYQDEFGKKSNENSIWVYFPKICVYPRLKVDITKKIGLENILSFFTCFYSWS